MPEQTPLAIEKLQRSVSIVHNPVTGWLVLGLSLIITIAAYYYASHQVETRAAEQFKFRSHEISLAISDRMAVYEQALISGVGLFAASNKVDRNEWKQFVNTLQLETRLPGIQAMGYAIPIAPDELNDHINKIRSEGFGDFHVRPEGEREAYSSIIFIEPFDWRNQRAFGYDMWSNELRRQAMARARDTGLPSTSGVITLVQETQTNVQKGFLTYVPVYNTGVTPGTVKERQQNLKGWVYAAFRAGDLMAGILGSSDLDIAFEIRDGNLSEDDSLIFNSAVSSKNTFATALFKHTEELEVQGRSWTVTYSANPDLLKHAADANQPRYILIGGIIIDILLFYVIISLHFLNTHRKKASEELHAEYLKNQASLALQAKMVEAAEKESETFFELAPEAFIVVNKEGRIVKANRHAHELFQFDYGALKNLEVDELVPQAARSTHHLRRKSYHENPTQRIMGTEQSLMAVKKNGEQFPTSINLAPIDYAGEPHVVAAVTDISAQKSIEESLAKAKENAEAASRSKSEFVANMSHEIRTPLNAVLGAAQLLENTHPSQDQQKYIGMIRSSGEALLGVINDILDFSKIEAGAMELTETQFKLSEVLSRVAIMMSVNAGEKDIELIIHVEANVPTYLNGDPLRLQQVIINLSSNAIKFTDKGQVRIYINADIAKNTNTAHIHISVSDTGIGMNKEQQARLFNAFAQADASISRKFGGTGLGLVISNRIIEMMGSKIELTSEPGVGSDFYFDVDFATKNNQVELPNFSSDKLYKVLILDDNRATIDSVTALINQWQWHLTAFTSWDETLNKLSNSQLLKTLDFVLIACNFASLGASDALNNLKLMGLNPQCASILTLANNQQAALMIGRSENTFNATCVKPIFSSNLLDAMQEASFSATGKGIVKTEHRVTKEQSKLNGLHLLLVEDNPFNQTIATGMLEDMGATLEIANNGQEAVEHIKQHGDRFDAVLMDIQMPVMDGVTATKILRNEHNWTKPVIAMTAGVLKSEVEEYLAVGMDNLVPKPVDSNDLFRALHRALNGKAKLEEEIISQTEAPAANTHTLTDFDERRIDGLAKNSERRIRRMKEAITAIKDDGAETIAKISEALTNNETDKAKLALHNFKGVVSNYGGEALAHALEDIENTLNTGEPVNTERELTEVEIHFANYCAAAQKWIDKHTQA